MVKVYLDYQMWAYMSKCPQVKQFFVDKKVNDGWHYFLSVGHLEELQWDRTQEDAVHKGATNALEKAMKELAEEGVIKETVVSLPGQNKIETRSILQFCNGSWDYNISKYIVNAVDTHKLILKRNREFFQNQDRWPDPKTLFEGIPHTNDNEFKKVWQTNAVKSVMKKMGIFNPSYSYKTYNKVLTDYHDMIDVMTTLFDTLTIAGYKREKNERTQNSYEYDKQHAINATYCDVFITADKNFAAKFKAVAYYYGLDTKVLRWNNGTLE